MLGELQRLSSNLLKAQPKYKQLRQPALGVKQLLANLCQTINGEAQQVGELISLGGTPVGAAKVISRGPKEEEEEDSEEEVTVTVVDSEEVSEEEMVMVVVSEGETVMVMVVDTEVASEAEVVMAIVMAVASEEETVMVMAAASEEEAVEVIGLEEIEEEVVVVAEAASTVMVEVTKAVVIMPAMIGEVQLMRPMTGVAPAIIMIPVSLLLLTGVPNQLIQMQKMQHRQANQVLSQRIRNQLTNGEQQQPQIMLIAPGAPQQP
jgi:hypothetical protein